MASLWRRKDTKRYPFWYACFTDPHGRRLKKSTGQTSRSKALKMALQWQRASDMGRDGRLTAEIARGVVSEILASVSGGEGLASYTTREWFTHFARIKQDAQSADTAAQYELVMRDFLAHLGPKADSNLLSVSSADVRSYRDHRKKSGVSVPTINNAIVTLSSFFNAAVRDHVTSNNPCSPLEPLRDDVTPAARRKRPFSTEQLRSILAHASDDWGGVIRVAYYTAARLQNCVNLRVGNLDFDSTTPTITFDRYAKTGDAHTVPMHPALADYFRARQKPARGKVIKFPAVGNFLFLSLAGRPSATLSKGFRKLLAEAGIQNYKVRQGAKGEGKGRAGARASYVLGFHSLRRTHISALANLGVSEETRMSIAAHKSARVHAGYTDHQLTELHKAVSKLPAL